MKLNNSRYWYSVLLLVALSVAAVLFWKSGAPANTTHQTRTSQNLFPATSGTVSGTVKTTDSTYEAVKEQREQKLNEMATAPIDFYGKVIDEKGNPVAVASTFYIVGAFGFQGSPTLEGPKTDNNGLFAITGKHGPDFSIRVEHPDYYKTASADQQVEYARKAYVQGKSPPLPPNREKPSVFVLKKKGVTEPLINYQRIKVKLPMNATPVSINARTGQIGSEGKDIILVKMKSDGDKLPLNTFHAFDWTVTIEIPGGGLVERSDLLNFEAPAKGYVQQLTIDMPASLPQDAWKADVQTDYFVNFGSGDFGRIRLNLSGDKGRVIAEVFLNPTPGSRNLEFDPAKAVKSP